MTKAPNQKSSKSAKNTEDITAILTDAILALSPQQTEKIVSKLMPLIAAYEMRQPRIWGDAKRVTLRTTIHINDLLINTRSGNVTIEKDVLIGHRCKLLTGSHNYRKKGHKRRMDVPDSGNDIHIDEGVWLGSGVTVIGPCVIGADAVIASGSLVTTNQIPAGTMWAGNPAKQVKKIDFDKE